MSTESGVQLRPFPFDRVEIEGDGEKRTLTPGEFFALPLPTRIAYVIQEKAAFWCGDVAVDARKVLAEVRRSRVA